MMWLRGSVGGAQVTSRVSNFLYDSLLRSLSEHLRIYYVHNMHIFSLSLSLFLSHTHTHTYTLTHSHTHTADLGQSSWMTVKELDSMMAKIGVTKSTNMLEVGRYYTFLCVIWLIHMCDITRSYVWYYSFICVILLIHMCDITHSYVWYYSFICVILLVHVWYYSFICVTNMLEVGRYYTFSITHIYM